MKQERREGHRGTEHRHRLRRWLADRLAASARSDKCRLPTAATTTCTSVGLSPPPIRPHTDLPAVRTRSQSVALVAHAPCSMPMLKPQAHPSRRKHWTGMRKHYNNARVAATGQGRLRVPEIEEWVWRWPSERDYEGTGMHGSQRCRHLTRNVRSGPGIGCWMSGVGATRCQKARGEIPLTAKYRIRDLRRGFQ